MRVREAPKRSHTADEKGGRPGVGHAQKRGRETSGKPYDQPPDHTCGSTGPRGQARADVPASQPEQSGKRGGRGGGGDDGDGGDAGGDGSDGGVT